MSDRTQTDSHLDFMEFAINHADEGIAVVNENGSFVYVNDAQCRNLEYSRDELLAMSIPDIDPSVTPENWPSIWEKIRGTGSITIETEHRTKHGTPFSVELSIKYGVFNDKECCVAVNRDITKRKLLEKALLNSQRNMESVLNNTQDGIVRVDRNFRHIFANPAVYKATGLSEKQYLGKTNREIGFPEEICTSWQKKHESVFRNGKPETSEFSFFSANKGERVYQAVVTPEFNENQEVETIISIMRDITDLKRAESEKDAVIADLEKALAEVKKLSGMLPICASCKKIRDDKGYWNQIESYIGKHSDAQFSHGICPDCAKKLYGDLYEETIRWKTEHDGS